MPFYKETLKISFLGYAAIFACIGVGFSFIKTVREAERGTGCWSITFILNAIGFAVSSGIVPISVYAYFLIAEVFHFAGFIFLLCGVYLFSGYRVQKWNAAFIGALVALWAATIVLFTHDPDFSTIFIRSLRGLIFLSAGSVILVNIPKKELVGRRLAGISLVLWGIYSPLYGFLRIDSLRDFIFGLLPGLQILAAFGLVAMVIDRIRIRAEEGDKRISQLERLLPTCAYCRKIRDAGNEWHNIETYIENHTSSQFSHGICPECMEKNFPEYAGKRKPGKET